MFLSVICPFFRPFKFRFINPALLINKQLFHHTTKNAGRSVFVSKSTNIYENLALEEWFFKNWTYENKEVLMLWVNSPCVVFGRHQNPWKEVNLSYLSQNTVLPARRNSGGGTVYHDLGNLNCTFFTTRANYHRKRNLSFICEVLNKFWGFNASVSERDDILLNGNLKISGTASKLANKNAYHHCTLLIHSEFNSLSHALSAPKIGLNSNATNSVPATVTKLNIWNPEVTLEAVQSSLSQHFLVGADKNVQYVEPSDTDFPGWSTSVGMFKSWDWIFGKTPKFSATIPTLGTANLQLFIENGRIVRLSFDPPTDMEPLDALRQSLLNSELSLVTHQNLLESLSRYRVMYERYFNLSTFSRMMEQLCCTTDRNT